MTGIATTALVAFFVASGVGSTSLPSAWAAQAPQAPIYAAYIPVYQVSMTGYNATPEQTDSDPDITASGAFADPNIVAARSRDLADELPFGTVISVSPAATSSPGCGYGVVSGKVGLRVIADTMNARMHNKVDILFNTTSSARTFGVCKDMTISVVGHVDPNHLPKDQLSLKLAIGQRELAVNK